MIANSEHTRTLARMMGRLTIAVGLVATAPTAVTGQAAWFDLRVRVRKCGAQERDFTEPRFDRLKLPPGLDEAPDRLSFGAEFRPSRGRTR